MKKLLLPFVALLFCLAMIADEPLLSEKQLSKTGYAEKKMKNAPRKVFINGFFVNYQLVAGAAAVGYTGNSRTGMTVALDGVDSKMLQQITDNAYQHFVKQLTDKGYEIMPASSAQNLETFEDWQLLEGGTPSKAQLTGFLATAPNGYKYFVKKVTKKGKSKRSFFDKTSRISKDLGAIVFDGTVNFQYIILDASSNYLNNSTKVKANVNLNMASAAVVQSQEGGALGNGKIEVLPTGLRFVYGGHGKGAAAESVIGFGLKKPVNIPRVIEPKKFKEYTADPNRHYGTPSYYGVMFTRSAEVNVTHRVQADTEAYKKQVSKALNEYLDLVLGKFLESAENS